MRGASFVAQSPPDAGARRGGNPALRLALIRRWHTWLGVFIAPSILFFAVSGSLQLFSLHEAHGDYHPPALFLQLGSLHKDQKLATPKPPRPAAAPPTTASAAASADAHDDADHDHDHADADHADADHDHAGPPAADKAPGQPKQTPVNILALKWLFLAVAIGLIASTSLGLWMALAYGRDKRLLWFALAAGIVLPVLLVVV
jgi:hypothetical protein